MQSIHELSGFLRMRMGLHRLVSGSFIKKLAEISQAPGSLTPRIVMAITKENATCSNTTGLVGTSIGSSDLGVFKTNDALVQKAEGFMLRARVLMNECDIYDVEKVGDLDIQLVKFVFNSIGGAIEQPSDTLVECYGPLPRI